MIYAIIFAVAVAAFLAGHFFGFTAGRKKITFEITFEGKTKRAHVIIGNMTDEERAGVMEIFTSTLAEMP